MNRTLRPPSPIRALPFALLLAAFSLAALAPPAHAGLGDLVKKAKDKAAQAVSNKATGKTAASGGGTVEFTDELLELNGERLDQVLKGLEAGDQVLAGRAALVTKRDRLRNEAGTIVNQHGPAMDAAREKHDTAERCWREFLDEKRSERDEEMRQKAMSDPAIREKMMGLTMRMAEAQAAGDSVAMSRLVREAEAMSGPTHADSLAARQKCGPVPPPHPMDAKVEALRREAAAADEQIRANDQKSIDAQVAASGLTAAQFAMARERLLLWLAAIRSKGQPRGFSSVELAAIDERRPALETALQPWAD